MRDNKRDKRGRKKIDNRLNIFFLMRSVFEYIPSLAEGENMNTFIVWDQIDENNLDRGQRRCLEAVTQWSSDAVTQ